MSHMNFPVSVPRLPFSSHGFGPWDRTLDSINHIDHSDPVELINPTPGFECSPLSKAKQTTGVIGFEPSTSFSQLPNRWLLGASRKKKISSFHKTTVSKGINVQQHESYLRKRKSKSTTETAILILPLPSAVISIAPEICEPIRLALPPPAPCIRLKKRSANSLHCYKPYTLFNPIAAPSNLSSLLAATKTKNFAEGLSLRQNFQSLRSKEIFSVQRLPTDSNKTNQSPKAVFNRQKVYKGLSKVSLRQNVDQVTTLQTPVKYRPAPSSPYTSNFSTINDAVTIEPLKINIGSNKSELKTAPTQGRKSLLKSSYVVIRKLSHLEIKSRN